MEHNETVLDKDGNEIYNSTGYPVKLKENGKLSLSGIKEGDQIQVSTYIGSEKVVVAYIQGGHIFCDNDGIEMCVALKLEGDRLYFKDVTE